VDSGNVAVRALEVDKMANGSRDSTNDFVTAGASDSKAGSKNKCNFYGK
jgi:hypothetical protein